MLKLRVHILDSEITYLKTDIILSYKTFLNSLPHTCIYNLTGSDVEEDKNKE